MDLIICSQCEKAKTAVTCGCCGHAVCKSCVEVLPDDAFAYLTEDRAELKHGTYCRPCFDAKIAPQLADYEALLEAAKNIDIFFKTQGKETRLVRRKEKPVKVEGSEDRDETIMRLAFIAAQGGYDSVVDVEVKAEKWRDHAYQKSVWRGTGVPANSKGKVITTDKSIWHNPN